MRAKRSTGQHLLGGSEYKPSPNGLGRKPLDNLSLEFDNGAADGQRTR
jgi:hypothetical protein